MDLERSAPTRQLRGDMAADTTQTYVRLAEQESTPVSPRDAPAKEGKRAGGWRKLLSAIWPFGRSR
jgi:hypothetical protein